MNYPFVALLALCTLYALWAGGGPERIGAAVYGLSVAASHLILTAHDQRWLNVETGVFIVDVVTFLAFVPIALRADRFWPLWVSAFLGLGVLGHLARLVGPDTFWWAYAVVLTIWSYPIVLLIALGTFLHRRRLARHGADRSWVSSSGRSDPGPPAGPTG
ncbi:MAG TPA: hypothetical protein VEC11_00595 [Allosphingosinicella sp.]|nr:hypothetical protein [Allosphingosinicella sp.]